MVRIEAATFDNKGTRPEERGGKGGILPRALGNKKKNKRKGKGKRIKKISCLPRAHFSSLRACSNQTVLGTSRF